jgi:hypothetical protein
LPRLRLLREQGVEVAVVTKPSSEHKGASQQDSITVVKELRDIGAQVQELVKMHQKLAIIDGVICWEGSLNILSHRETLEHMRRFKGKQFTTEITRNLKLA